MLIKDIFSVLEALVNSSLDDQRADKYFFLFNHAGLQKVESSRVKDVPVPKR